MRFSRIDIVQACLAVSTTLAGLCLDAVPPARAGDVDLSRWPVAAIKALRQGEQTANRIRANELVKCRQLREPERYGLRMNDGRVTGANWLPEIVGYAGAAATTGGLGGKLYTVKRTEDWDTKAGDKPIPDTVRAVVAEIARSNSPGWVVFDLPPGSVITLKLPLRLPSHITLDGSCSDFAIESKSVVGQIYMFNVSNVIVRGLAMHKTDYDSAEDTRNCLRANGMFDRIAILHNDLAACGDGLADFTISPGKPFGGRHRVTFAYNYLSDHDKVMLVGSFTCVEGPTEFARGCPRKGELGRPAAIEFTMVGNLFVGTGQRHPRVFGRASVHAAGNAIFFAPHRHRNGQVGASYGIFVSNGARALVEKNVFVGPIPKSNKRELAVWTVETVEGQKMPEDTVGSVRVKGNVTVSGEIVDEANPSDVPGPPYTLSNAIPGPSAYKSADTLIRCIAARAGRVGLTHWPAHCQ